ncbi:hypothetical protein [Nocardioides sp. Root190]|uniref:hypothetical protein n=1 Tax=Nocardioides sp. Root190 TaxID=1736488 RepID=UPI000A9725B6|nr:hypothetical protein [Nocardioides sp. Root190]
MRSERPADDGQAVLPFEVPGDGATGPDRPSVRPSRSTRAVRGPAVIGALPHRITTDALAARGLPAGTEVTATESGRRPVRGDVVLVRAGEQAVVGVFDLRFGRAVLRWDRGGMWLGPTTEVLGIVTAAEPPLAAM